MLDFVASEHTAMASLRAARATLGMLCVAGALSGQKTTDFSATVTLPDTPEVLRVVNTAVGTGPALGLGMVAAKLVFEQVPLASGVAAGPGRATATIATNAEDSFEVAFDFADPGVTAQFAGGGTIGNGRGVFAGASGTAQVDFTASRPAVPLDLTLNLEGTLVTQGRALRFRLMGLGLRGARQEFRSTAEFATPGISAALGNFTLLTSILGNREGFQQMVQTFRWNARDSFRIFYSYSGDPPPAVTGQIWGGSGAWEGASGFATARFTLVPGGGLGATMTGRVTLPATGTPVIRSVAMTASDGAIAANAWIEIQGTNLVPKDTPGGGVFWSNAPEFAQGKMPTQVGGVSATVSGKPAYVWWFCSQATTSGCTQDQVNVLTPPDAGPGIVPVVVKSSNGTSAPHYMAMSGGVSPSLLRLTGKGYALATRSGGGLVGPGSLYPGVTAPAQRGETITLWGTGFGLPVAGVETGSARQFGRLPQNPVCLIGDATREVPAVLVSPGLVQMNLTLPANLPDGDIPIVCTVGLDGHTPIGTLIVVE